MAILHQHPTQVARYLGWYGKCDSTEDCAPFPLLVGAGFSWTHTIGLNPTTGKSDIISTIYSLRDQAVYPGASQSYTGSQTGFALAFAGIKQLECGHIYAITLNTGTGSVDIPHLVAVSTDDDSAGYVTEDCTSAAGPAPTSTPTPTPTATDTVVPETTTATCCPDGHYQITTGGQGTSITSDEGITVQGLHDGGTICSVAPTGGIPDHFEVIYLGQSIGILTIPRTPGGSIMDGDDLKVYYTYDNNCFSGDLDEQNNRLSLELV